MASTGGRPRISPSTLALAALGSATATFLIGRFGLAGTIIGAALTPVVIALVTEIARRPAERLRTTAVRPPRRRSGGDQVDYRVEREPLRLLERVSWRRVVLTGLAAFALVVGVVTLADLGRGTAVVGDRGTTFFDRGRDAPLTERRDEGGGDAPTQPEETVTVEPAPTEETGTTPAPDPAPTGTEPTGTTPTTP